MPTQKYTITSFDPTGSTNSSASGINASGEIFGEYSDSTGYHGFVDIAGAITSFDPTGSTETIPLLINASGEIVGRYLDSAGNQHGFTDIAGAITSFDPTGSTYTSPVAINDSGEIVGYYSDSTGTHGFTDIAGVITPVDVPGATATSPVAINASGEIVGTYSDSTGAHGFTDIAGVITPVDVPGATATIPVAINDSGEIVGYYHDITGIHGFTDIAGAITLFDPAGPQSFRPGMKPALTIPIAINASGEIVGFYQDSTGITHGFADIAGVITTIDPPGSTYTAVTAINDSGEIVGYYQDSTGITHGFADIAGVITTIDPPGSTYTAVTAINDSGEIVGTYSDGTTYYSFTAIEGQTPPTITGVTPNTVEKTQTTIIGTVVPAVASDTLTVTKTGGSGSVTLQLVNGVEEVIYTAPLSVSASTTDAVSYTVTENGVSATGSASVQLDAGPTAGNTSVTEGHGKTVTLTTLVNGLVTAGITGDTETLTSVSATSGGATLASGNVTYTAPASGTDTISYTVQDQYGGTATGQVVVTVDPGPTVSPVATGTPSSGQTVVVGTVTSGLTGDVLTLVNTSGAGFSLSGNQVLYKVGTTPTNVSFQVQDQYGDQSPAVTVFIGSSKGGSQTVSGPAGGYGVIGLSNGHQTVNLSGSHNVVTVGNGNSKVSGGQNANVIVGGKGDSTVSLSGSGNSITLGNGSEFVIVGGGGNTVILGKGDSTISLGGSGNTITAGNGNDSITLAGSGNTVSLGKGSDTVHGGTGDTINLVDNTTLNLYGTHEMLFMGSGNSTINDFSTGMVMKIGPTAGKDILAHFASDPTGVVDLIGGLGGFTTTAAVLAALKSDGSSGTLLSFGKGSGSFDFIGVAPSALHASNFQIG